MKAKALAAILGVTLVSSSAYAADQGRGKVTFTGSITDAPCSIAPGALDQIVPLGAISNVALAENGNTGSSTPVPFSIELQNCIISTPGTKDKVTVTFTGASSSYDADSLGLIGTAEGAYILMSQTDGAKVSLNKPTTPQQIGTSSNTLTFTASLKGGGAGAVIKPGNFQVPTNFILTYQ